MVAAGDRVSSFLTTEGDCYSWGKVGRDTERSEPSRMLDGGDDKAIRTIRHGSAHTVALTTTGQALFWNTTTSRSRVTPRRIPAPAPTAAAAAAFQDVGCSDQRALLLSQDGRSVYEYSFPPTTSGAAAHVSPAGRRRRRQQQQQSPLRLVPFVGASVGSSLPVQITNIDCGPNHSAAVSTTGHLYTFGWGQHGRLGLGDEEARSSPQLVETLAKDKVPVVSVSCGSAHTCTLTTVRGGGRVYAFGSNTYGQVGSTAMDRYLHPHEILIDGQVSSVACGFGHTAAVTWDGALFCWGFNEEGQLGLGTEGQIVDVPTRVDGFPEDQSLVVKVACGHLHTLCVTCSNLSPSEIDEYKCRMEQLERASATVLRFARFALLRIRLRQNMRPNSAAEEHGANSECDEPDNSSESESTHSISSDGFMIRDEDTSTGSDNSNASDPPDMNTADDAIRRHQEMTAMAMEDHACHLIREEEKTRVEELRRQEELELMMAEDEASCLVRSAGKRILADARQDRAHRKIADRNARVTASIQREANRLKQARDRQREQANAKMKLPPVNRRRRRAGRTGPISSKISMPNQKNSGHTESRRNNRTPKPNNVETAQSLLEKRRTRLEEQSRIERERLHKRDQETEWRQRAEKQRQLSVAREKERLEKERKKRVGHNLEELKGKLRLGPSANATQNPMDLGNKGSRQRFNFKTAEQWSQELKRNNV